MIGFKFLNRIGSMHPKEHTKTYIKKKFSSYHSSFVINKNMFFLKLITPKLNGQFFREKSW